MIRLSQSHPLFAILVLACALWCASPGLASAADWTPEPGSSADFTMKMHSARKNDKNDEALQWIDKCVAKYGEKAAQQQKSLTAPPTKDEDKEVTKSRAALNDVGVCLFYKGDILLKSGDKAGAKAAYTKLTTEFSYARCWDPKGWFWSPADAATKILKDLE